MKTWTVLAGISRTLVLLGLAALPLSAAENNWPQFRGPEARGVGVSDALPDRWSATENVIWKTDIAGRGWSSPIIWGNRIFLTTVVNLGKSEEPKKGLYFGGERKKPADSVHQWKIVCLNLANGRLLWQRQVHEGKPKKAIHIKNSYASETPVTDGQHLYCYFGNLGVFCLDLDGTTVWSKRLEPLKTAYDWGTAASPVLHENRLYIINDNEEDSYLLALDKRTGKKVWRVSRDEKSNWSTPFIWKNDRRTEIITTGSGTCRSYDLEGKLLWSLKGMGAITIATPYEYKGLLYFSSGYVMAPLRPIYAIRPGATGDISLTEEEDSNDWIVWCQKKGAPYNPSTLAFKDRLYVLYDRGFFASFNAADGTKMYRSQRIPEGRAFTCSPWAYDDKIFCLNENGITYVIAASDDFKILHTNTLAEDDMCMSTPAFAGDRLLIRTSERVYCIGEKGK